MSRKNKFDNTIGIIEFTLKVIIPGGVYLPYGYTEFIVQEYYEKLGYVVCKCKKIGEPDFFVSKKKEGFYVEVKRVGEHLRLSQLDWIHSNLDKKIIIFWVDFCLPEVTIMDLQRKMRDKK